MSPNDKYEEWKRDAQAAADPSVLPEYTVLPQSPSLEPGSPPPQALPPAAVPTDADAHSDTSSSSSHSGSGAAGEGKRIARVLRNGVLALVIPPVILTGAAIAATAAMLYGSGKMLEGVGRAVAAGPELLYKACVGRRARAAWGAVRGRRAAAPADVEAGAIAI